VKRGVTTASLLHLVLLSLSAPAGAQTDTFLDAGAAWRYLDDGSDPGATWTSVAFDDSSWPVGSAQLGYGDGDEATVVSYGPDPLDKHVTTWFRHEFEVSDASPYVAATVELLVDDGAVVHLNGVELLRHNLPAGAIDSETLALWEVSGAAESIFHVSDHEAVPLQSGTNVLAVELHQADPAGPDLSFDLALRGHTQPLLRRAPYLQMGGEDRIRIRWRTFPAADSGVWFGPAPDELTSFVSDAAAVSDHEVELLGLAPDTTYFYAVGTASAPFAGGDVDHFFVTHPPLGDPRPARYWVLGDSGTASPDAEAVRDAYYGLEPGVHTDLWLMLGDNAYLLGSDVEYQIALFDIYPEMLRRSVLWPARGNWETSAATFYGIFSFPTAGESGGTPSGTEAYSSFDHGSVHFVRLDSAGSDRSVGGPMWTWLEADLAATSQEWIIAYWHHPPYSKGGHDSDTDPGQTLMRENFGPLLEAGGVDLVLCGHSHSYERSFLLDGHYDTSDTLTPTMLLDDGDGREEGSGAYTKLDEPNRGTVYLVCGSSGGANPINELHPAMYTALAIAGSVVIDVDGGRLDARFLSATGAVEDHWTLLSSSFTGAYCVALEHSEGCAAGITAVGTASATSASPYELVGEDLPRNKPGMLFYGYGPARVPFFQGLRCVAPALRRTQVQSSGGVVPCEGGFSYDFNARIQSGLDPELVPGVTVYAQYWFRDAGSSNTSSAWQFVIGP